ncbi:MAG TPA: acetylglutamate kinase [Acidimicrobiales bacterium]|nr:acetylglutamate kinase [Acidimicrobiales bacterium]
MSAVEISVGDKAAVLAEALPYIRRFYGKTIVVKFGGNAMGHDLSLFAEDVALLHSVGMRVVVVHGGGPQIGELMSRLGKETTFIGGHRVTDAETLDIARMVLVGKVNRDIVRAINVHGSLAVGLSGEDAGFLRARPRSPELGFVGDIESVAPAVVQRLLSQDLVPVVATIGADAEGQSYNINADTAAGAIAIALEAEKLVYLTDIEGIRADVDDQASLLSTVAVDELDAMVESGAVTTGMVPKVASCAGAVRAGVGHAHILDGRVPHVLLLEVFTRSGIGTMVSR